MSRGGFSAHLASLHKAQDAEPPETPAPAPDRLQLLASTTDIVLGHRDKITAGVPGCTCGKTYPEDSHGYFAVLHAQHVAAQTVAHALTTVVAAILADHEDFAGDPSRWVTEGHDNLAAIEAINKLRHDGSHDRTREATTP